MGNTCETRLNSIQRQFLEIQLWKDDSVSLEDSDGNGWKGDVVQD